MPVTQRPLLRRHFQGLDLHACRARGIGAPVLRNGKVELADLNRQKYPGLFEQGGSQCLPVLLTSTAEQMPQIGWNLAFEVVPLTAAVKVPWRLGVRTRCRSWD